MNTSRPLSQNIVRKPPRFIALFFGIFLLVGLGAAYAMSGGVVDFIRSGSWVQIPCTIDSSAVGSHSGKGGSTYSIDISYHYDFQDKTYHSKHYSFITGSSSGYEGKEGVVKKFPPNSTRTCFVDPKNPSHSVLYRGWSLEMLFILFPLVFVAIGTGGIYFTLRSKQIGNGPFGNSSEKVSLVQSSTTSSFSPATGSGPLVMKPKTSAFAKMCGAFIFSLFWNGIVSIFVYQAVKAWQQGHVDWFMTLFMIPFVLVGLATVGMIFYFMLSIGNPVAKLALNPSAIPLGETLRLGWGFDGKTSRIQNLRLILEAREEATYRRGTSTYTDKNIFLQQEIINLTDPRQIVQGLAEIEIPKNLVPSFASANNRIIWTLTLHGSIPRWPDVTEEFEITVLPARRSL